MAQQEKAKPELPAAGQKLIHSGKVLKDSDVISTCGIKPNDFLVVMITKVKAPAPVAAAAASTSVPGDSSTTPKASDTSSAETPAPTSTTATSAPPAPTRADTIPQEAVDNLTAMGFPEAEVRHCLRAAEGNPDVAVEYLTNGIPDGVAQVLNSRSTPAGAATPAAANSSSTSGSGGPLQALRNHPQFNDLRRLVQSNPQMLQQVLAQIGQQQPELLQEINSNQARFLEMMNEPITGETASSPAPAAPGAGLMGMEGLGDPAQMAQVIQNLSPAELEQMAQMMGLTPDQLQMTAQTLGRLPPEQLQQFMMQAMGGGGEGAMGSPGGQQVLRLTEEEMAAVDRLADLGFDRSEAAQAFLACDKNEALAANLLMDSMGDGGAFGGGGGSGNNGGSGDGNNDEDMYE